MAELAQLEDALRKADAAGNTADATAIASEIRRMRSQAGPKPVNFEQASAALDATRTTASVPYSPLGALRNKGGFEPANEAPTTSSKPAYTRRPEPADSSNIGLAFKTDFVADEGTKLRILAEELFPGDPTGIDRVGIRNGKPVFVNDEGKLQYVSGTGSRIAASVAAYAPEIIGSVAGTLTGGPVIGGGLGAGLARGTKRRISELVFDEPVTRGSLAKEVALETGVSALAGLAGKGVAGVADRGRVVDFTPTQLAQAERTRALVLAQTGLDIDLAQAAGDRRLLALRDYASRYPGRSAELIQARDEALSGQFDIATNRVLNLVSQPAPSGRLGEAGINAAQEVIRSARTAVSQQVRPLYEAAYAAVPEITDVGLLNFLKLPYFDSAFKAGQRIAKLEGTALGPGDLPSLRSFDYLKQGLDDVIERLESKGARKEARALRERKNEFVAQLDGLSNQQYQAARQAYAQGIETTVAPLENGLVGTLAKLDPQQASIASRIFTDPSVTPEQIALFKASISRYNPDAYRGLVRQYLDDAYDKAQVITQGGDTTNVPGKFLKTLAPTPAKEARLKAILPPNAYPVLQDLLAAAERLATTPLGASRTAGSNTLRDQTISEILKGRATAVAKSLLTPRQAIRDSVEQRAQEQGVIDLTEALLDPSKRDQLRRIVKMTDPAKQAILLGTIFTGQAAAGTAQDLTENAAPGTGSRL